MAQIVPLFLILLANALLGLAIPIHDLQTIVDQSKSSSDPPALSPLISGHHTIKSEAPISRKMGRHQHYQHHKTAQYSLIGSPSVSPYIAPQENNSLDQTASSSEYQGQEIHLVKSHQRSIDKSVAGGGVILLGLATTFLVAVFCYIRATERHKAEGSM